MSPAGGQVGLQATLISYSQLTGATFNLLHCVSVPGQEDSVVFLNATTQCYTAFQVRARAMTRQTTAMVLGCGVRGHGQRFLFVLLVVLVLVPVGLAWLTHRRLGGPTVTALLSSPYRDEYRWWTAVLVSDVLVFNALNSFLGSDPGRRALCFGAAAALSVVFQCLMRPYTDEQLPVNALQALSKFSWVMLAFLGMPAAMADVFGASLAQTSRAAVPAVRDWAGVFLIFPAALVPVAWLGSQNAVRAAVVRCAAIAFPTLFKPTHFESAAATGTHSVMLEPLDRPTGASPKAEGGSDTDDRSVRVADIA